MASLNEKKIETDILVVGSGGAGCFAAIKAKERGANVIIVNKVPWLGGSTMMARAGYSAALGITDSRDNSDLHFHDSFKGGDYMGNQGVLKTMCRDTVEATNDLVKWGAVFSKNSDGQLDQGAGQQRLAVARVMVVTQAGVRFLDHLDFISAERGAGDHQDHRSGDREPCSHGVLLGG